MRGGGGAVPIRVYRMHRRALALNFRRTNVVGEPGIEHVWCAGLVRRIGPGKRFLTGIAVDSDARRCTRP